MATAASKTRAQPAVDPQRLYEATAAAAEFYTHQLPSHQPATDYLQSRGIADAAAPGSPWQIGVAPPGWRGLLNHLAPRFSVEELLAAGLLTHNRTGGPIDRFRDRLVFPITDRTGQIAGFTGRDLSGRPRTPKWVNSPDTAIYAKSRLLYGLGPHLQHRPPGQATPLVVVVEGAADALAVWRMAQTMPHRPNGIPIYAAAPCGTNLTTQQLQLLHEQLPAGSRLAVALDGDAAGRAGFLRAYPLLRHWPGRAWAMTLPAGYDPARLLAERGPDAALAELATQLAPAARTALGHKLDQLIESGRITRPRDWVEHRLLAYQAIAGFFMDNPADTPALAQAAGDRLGLPPGVVTHGVMEQLYQPDIDELALAEPGQDIASQAVADWLHPRTRPQPSQRTSPPSVQDQPDRAKPRPAHRDQPTQQAPDPGPEPVPEPDREPHPEPEAQPVEVDREQPSANVSWVSAFQHRRWPAADAAAFASDPATGRFAWALADAIGERPQARAAAEVAARIAAQTAARANPAAAVAAAGAALSADPTAGDEDAAIAVVTAHHPAGNGATRFELAWSGNVRAYALLGGQVVQISADHTVAQQRRDAGHQVTDDSQLHHLLTASVRHGTVSRTSIVLPPGGALLLCTAGAYRNLDPILLRQALGPVTDPQATLARLLGHTAKGDNANAILLHAPVERTGAPANDAARLARLASAAAPASSATRQPPAAETGRLIAELRSLLGGKPQRARVGARR
jgi:DNA primase catalytic core